MKLGSFRIQGRETFGAVLDGKVIDLGLRLEGRHASLRSFLAEKNWLEVARGIMDDTQPDFALADATCLPVIPSGNKIFCIGVNYADHLEETRIRKATHPTVFLRYAESQTGHLQPLLHPRESTQFDFEGEVALVIGQGGRRIPADRAWDHIAGYACYNDGSVRDWQFHTTQWGPGKNFVSTGAFGPWMTATDEIDPRKTPLTLTTRVNGSVVQQSNTDCLIFGIPELIRYCSTLLPLAPGDVIVTGTPGGVGMAREPQLFLKPGDQVEVEVSGVGTLVNGVQMD